nr:PREDICTED: zinc finger protein 395 [Apteryx mantelli mantelli]
MMKGAVVSPPENFPPVVKSRAPRPSPRQADCRSRLGGSQAQSRVPSHAAPWEDGPGKERAEESSRAPRFPSPNRPQLHAGQQVVVTYTGQERAGLAEQHHPPSDKVKVLLPERGPRGARRVEDARPAELRKADAAVEMDEMVAAAVCNTPSRQPITRGWNVAVLDPGTSRAAESGVRVLLRHGKPGDPERWAARSALALGSPAVAVLVLWRPLPRLSDVPCGPGAAGEPGVVGSRRTATAWLARRTPSPISRRHDDERSLPEANVSPFVPQALPSIQIPVSPHIFTSISWATATSTLPSLSPVRSRSLSFSEPQPATPMLKSHLIVASPPRVSLGTRKVRGEAKKCRKVYGIEHRDQWCTACRWKKACQRFLD